MSDKCRDILINAAYNNIKLNRTDVLKYRLKELFLSDQFKNHVKNQGSGFNIKTPQIGDLPPIELNANSTDNEFKEFRNRVETLKEEELYTATYINLTAQLVNEKAIEEWGKCMEGNRDLEIQGKIQTANDPPEPGDSVYLDLKWNKRGRTDPAPIVESFSYSPLELGNHTLNIKSGTVIETDGVTQGLTIPKGLSRPVIIALNTTRDNWFGTLIVKGGTTDEGGLKGIWKGKKKYVAPDELLYGREFDLEWRIEQEPKEGQNFVILETSEQSNGPYKDSPIGAIRKGNRITSVSGGKYEIDIIGQTEMLGKMFRGTGKLLAEYYAKKV